MHVSGTPVSPLAVSGYNLNEEFIPPILRKDEWDKLFGKLKVQDICWAPQQRGFELQT